MLLLLWILSCAAIWKRGRLAFCEDFGLSVSAGAHTHTRAHTCAYMKIYCKNAENDYIQARLKPLLHPQLTVHAHTYNLPGRGVEPGYFQVSWMHIYSFFSVFYVLLLAYCRIQCVDAVSVLRCNVRKHIYVELGNGIIICQLLYVFFL